MPSQEDCESVPLERTRTDVNYASYKPTVDALRNAKKPMTVEEVSKITGRNPSLEAMALFNLQQANLLKQTRKYFKDFYKLQSIDGVYRHFNVEKDEAKEINSRWIE